MRLAHRTIAVFAVVALALASPVVAAGADGPPQTGTGSALADFARRATGRDFYGLYLLGIKVGWGSEESRVTEYAGSPAFENTVELRVEAAEEDTTTTLATKTVTLYSLEGEGQLLRIADTLTDDGVTVERVAVREGSQLRITTRADGRTTERLVPLPRDTLKVAADAEAWLARPPRKAEKFTIFSVDLAADEVESTDTITFREPTTLVWGGVPVRASRVVMTVGGARFKGLVDERGKLLRGKLGRLFTVRAEEESVARALPGVRVDLAAVSQIPVSTPLGDPERIATLALEIAGLGDLVLPTSARQRITPVRRGRVLVELQREPADGSAEPITPGERERYLRATASIDSDNEAVTALAQELARGEDNPERVARRLGRWVFRNLEAAYGSGAATASSVLARKAGDATEHALLFTALARAAGIPTRQVGGIVYVDEPTPQFGWHVWAEIHDGHRWISVDPMWGQLRVDPGHVRFSGYGEADGAEFAWIELIDAVKVSVKSVQPKLLSLGGG